jgi:hypothetical protein
MQLWTLIADYAGGTYIEQTSADSLKVAVEKICEVTESKFLLCLLDKDLDDPTPITGVESTWCLSALFEDELVNANIVLTCKP